MRFREMRDAGIEIERPTRAQRRARIRVGEARRRNNALLLASQERIAERLRRRVQSTVARFMRAPQTIAPQPTSVTAPPETNPGSDQEVQEGVGSLAQCREEQS